MPDPASQQAIEAATRLQVAGRVAEAERLCRDILLRDPENAAALRLLGALTGSNGRSHEAVDLLNRCLAIDPNDAAAHTMMGAALQALDRKDEALEHFHRAVALQPGSAQFHYNLGKAQRDAEQFEASVESFRRALAIEPHLPPALNNLGNSLRDLGRLEEAVPLYQRALQIRANHPPTLHNLGLALRGLMRLDEATRCFDTALAFDPGHHECRVSRAMLLLLLGDFSRGWREYERRWEISRAFTKRTYPRPFWDGLDPEGRTILLHYEQGFGDTNQFVRYAPLVRARGARVILECQPELCELFETIPGVDEIVTVGDDVPEFDQYRALMSLPMLFGTTLQSIPAEVPYLSADPARVASWKAMIPADGLRVGLVWAGAAGYANDRNRSLSLARLGALGEIPGVHFVGLQKGAAAVQGANPPPGMKLMDVGEKLHDFADTAAVLENLDLVITIDTAAGHLAGALAKPVWLLIPHSPDWRWLLDREDSPWYPTMRLFRQPRIGDWDSVLDRVKRELAAVVKKQSG